MQVLLRRSASKQKRVLFLPFATKTTANLAMHCVTEFSWQERKMPMLHCGFCIVEFFTRCLMNYVRACVALRYLLLEIGLYTNPKIEVTQCDAY